MGVSRPMISHEQIEQMQEEIKGVKLMAREALQRSRVIVKVAPWFIEYEGVDSVVRKIIDHLGMELEYTESKPSTVELIKKKKPNG